MVDAQESSSSKRVALVTGAARGIGRGVALALSARGWCVHAAIRSESGLAQAVQDFGESRVHRADLDDPAAARSLMERVLERDGQLNGLVHAVGPYLTRPLSETSPDDFQDMLQGNLFTALHMIDAARAPLRAARGASLFFGCAGLDRWRAREVTTAYIAAKSALLVTMRGLAVEEARYGVRANMISPGFVPHEGAAPDTLSADLQQRIPLGRPAEMREVADAAAWLLSPEASHVVGQNLEIAGGWML